VPVAPPVKSFRFLATYYITTSATNELAVCWNHCFCKVVSYDMYVTIQTQAVLFQLWFFSFSY